MRIVLETVSGETLEVSENDYDADSLADAEIVLRRLNRDIDGERSSEFSYSYNTSLRLCGEAANLIRREITDLSDPKKVRNAYVNLLIYDDCCVENFLLYRGRITIKSLDWCEFDEDSEICCIEINTEEYTKTIERSECIRDTLIESHKVPFEGYSSFWEYPHATMQYCLNHNKGLVVIYSTLLNMLFLITSVILIALSPIFLIVELLVGIVNGALSVLGADAIKINLPDLSDLVIGTVANFFEYLIYPCNFAHITPKVKNYIKNVCNHCGLTFESSILNSDFSPYGNLLYFYNQNDRGYKTNLRAEGADLFSEYGDERLDYQIEYFSNYSPNITGGSLLDSLSIPFNAEWWVDGDVLRFEKKRTQKELFLDITNLPKNVKVSQCYNLTEIDRYYRIADFRWATDGEDLTGDNNKFLCQDVVKLSDNLNFKSLKEINIPFGAVSCEGREKDNVIKMNEPIIKNMNVWITAISALSLDFTPPTISTEQYEGVLFLTTGSASQPKLIIPDFDNDGTLIDNFSTVKTKEFQGERFPQPEMWVSAASAKYNKFVEPFDYSEPPQSNKIIFDDIDNLFQFHKDLDPDLDENDFIGIEVEVIIKKRCEYYQSILNKIRVSGEINHNLYIIIEYRGNEYEAFVEEIKITLNEIEIKAVF